jgi:hypothetical protein
VIVISGALVLVALILLVLGLTMTDLDFVYGSIGVSLVSFVFLVIGILQRRGEQPAPAGEAPQVSDASAAPQVSDDAAVQPEPVAVPVTAPATRTARVAAPAPVVVEEEYDDEELEPGGGTVLVVPGRPRYHLEGCRYLTGKSAEEIDVLDAREDGFTPCGVCKPDAALEALALDDEPVEDDVEPAPVDEPTVVAPVADTGVPGTADEVDAAPARPRRTARTGRGSTVLTAAPAETPPVVEDPDSAEPVDDELVPVAPPVAAVPPSPRARARSAAATGDGAAKPVGRSKVVVIPDRGRFHTPTCRFVRDVLGTEELSRAAAAKQGFKPCGVCKP